MSNNYNYVLTLQNQIAKLKSAFYKEELISVIRDTISKFPVEQKIVAHFLSENVGYQNIRIEEWETHNLASRRNDYIHILEDELTFIINNQSFVRWTDYAVNLLYYNPPYFTDDYVVHKSGKGKLKVADVLSVIGYATKLIETAGVKVNEKFSIALIVLNTIDLALNNQKQDKPFNKSLHIANDVLTEIAKKVADDKRLDPALSGISLSLDLTIDFLIKE